MKFRSRWTIRREGISSNVKIRTPSVEVNAEEVRNRGKTPFNVTTTRRKRLSSSDVQHDFSYRLGTEVHGASRTAHNQLYFPPRQTLATCLRNHATIKFVYDCIRSAPRLCAIATSAPLVNHEFSTVSFLRVAFLQTPFSVVIDETVLATRADPSRRN